MRPKWKAPAAAACVLVLAACGGGGGEASPKAAAGAETFDLAAAATDAAAAAAAPTTFMPAYAVTGTVEVRAGKEPVAVAVNPKTNKIYVANKKSDNVTIIDGRTNKVTGTVKVGLEPNAVRINPNTNKIYVAALKGQFPDGSEDPNGNGTVTVIDGATNKTKTVEAGLEPYAMAINTKTDKVYVINQGSNDMTVITGKTNKTATVQLRPDNPKDIYDGILTPRMWRSTRSPT